jgi:hypothetical protein
MLSVDRLRRPRWLLLLHRRKQQAKIRTKSKKGHLVAQRQASERWKRSIQASRRKKKRLTTTKMMSLSISISTKPVSTPPAMTNPSRPAHMIPSDYLTPVCLAAYHRAQKLLIVASSPEDLPLPADLQAQKCSEGKINFLSVHFNSLGLDTLCEVGWAKAAWSDEGDEVRVQGRWM